MKFKSMFKNPVKEFKGSVKKVQNPGKTLKREAEGIGKDLRNPKEALSDRWENFKDDPFPSLSVGARGYFAQPRGGVGQPGGPKAPGMMTQDMGGQVPINDPGFSRPFMPPKNTRISPGIYADGSGGTVRSRMAPGPVQGGFRLPPGLPPRTEGGLTGLGLAAPERGPDWNVPLDAESGNRFRAANPGFHTLPGMQTGKPLATTPAHLPMPTISDMPQSTLRDPYAYPDGTRPPQATDAERERMRNSVPYGSTQTGRYAPGAMPANTRGDAMKTTPAKGTRISPGVYADGRGGTTLRTPNAIPRAGRR